MDLQLNDKSVVVTGGSRGIGLAIADAFAAEGAQVALCAALQFGWGAFEEEIVTGLQEFGVDRDALREKVSELSMRLGDG